MDDWRAIAHVTSVAFSGARRPMRAELRRAFDKSRPVAFARAEDVLPPELAFLAPQLRDPRPLQKVARRALLQNVGAEALLISEGVLTETTYYRALARHLGVSFVDNRPALAPMPDPMAALTGGVVALATEGSATILVAPSGETLRRLLNARAAQRDLTRIALTCPSHLREIVQSHAADVVADRAANALPDFERNLSAKYAVDRVARGAAVAVIVVAIVALLRDGHVAVDVFGLIFFASLVLRLAVCVAGLDEHLPEVTALTDAELPDYSVLVPLRNETDIVPELVTALSRIDYPRAKLQVLMLVEPEDDATRGTLAELSLPPWCHVVVGPDDDRTLRTKPRALNIGLMLARGSLVTVYDAEDRPDPGQLRLAAARFAGADETLACLQARLVIANGHRNWLARLFAIEYAALFDVFNIGLTALRFPMALGGTSNHFRTDILRDVGGWDAWNVTEDADLGLRLARFGYRVESLPSVTFEDAPERFGAWMKQRRRWTKGWMQTLLVLARDARNASRQFGLAKASIVGLMLTNLVTGPLLLPIFSAWVGYQIWSRGLPRTNDLRDLVEATLAFSVIGLGISSTLWQGALGLRKRHLGRFALSLPFLLPYQLMISVAAWGGLADLIMKPFHWHKTAHGRASRRR